MPSGVNTYFGLANHAIQSGAYDPSAVATFGRAGSIFIQTHDAAGAGGFDLWQKQDDGTSTNWSVVAGGGGGVTSVGTIDSVAKSADGAVISGTTIYFQTADGSFPGMLSLVSQNIVGVKAFSDEIEGFGQGGAPGVASGGTARIYADDLDTGAPDPATQVWKQIDATGNIRHLNGIIQDEGSVVVRSPQFINFVGAGVTAAPSGLGVDVTIPGGGSSATWERETFVIADPDIVNGYLDLANTAIDDSVMAQPQGSAPLIGGSIASGDDFEMSVVGPITRVTFAPAVVAAWLVGQRVQVQYQF